MKLTAPKQRQGDHFETLALRHLQAHGLTLIAKNWHYKNIGEIDLIMLDETQKIPCVVIVEVRQRTVSRFGSNFGNSLESITAAKQRKIVKTAQAFLQANPQFDNYDIRFDVVSFDHDPLAIDNQTQVPTWIIAAFYVN